MFGIGVPLTDPRVGYYATGFALVLLCACVAATPLPKTLWGRLPQKARAVVLPVLLLGGLVLSTAYLVDATYNPFLYFRF